MWEPGTKVECIDDSPYGYQPQSMVKKGGVYTVHECPCRNTVLLCEVDPPEGFRSFNARRFRPIVSRKLPESLTRYLTRPQELEPV